MEGGLSLTENIRILGTLPTALKIIATGVSARSTKRWGRFKALMRRQGTNIQEKHLFSSEAALRNETSEVNKPRKHEGPNQSRLLYKQRLETPSHGSPVRSHISHSRCGRDNSQSSASSLHPMSPRPDWPDTGPPQYWELLVHFQLDGNAWMAF